MGKQAPSVVNDDKKLVKWTRGTQVVLSGRAARAISNGLQT